MRIVLQRVLSASVSTVHDGVAKPTASIERGLCLYVGISTGDTKKVAQERAREVLEARLFDSQDGKAWQASVPSCGLSLLVISNYTLAGASGNAGRPDFRAAMKAAEARAIFDEFLAELRRLYRPERVLAGEFGAYMRVTTVNDGPVTMVLGGQAQAPPATPSSKNEGEVSATQKDTRAAGGATTAAPAAVARHAPAPPPGKTFAKRDALQSIEQAQQALWRRERIFERDAPLTIPSDASVRKFMATFPYPYMNGRLHLGHAYTYSKAEFATAFQRLMGKDTLLPFAYHCTGMPIKVCADRLLKEMREFGNPPIFPEDAVGEAEGDEKQPAVKAAPASSATVDPTAHHGKKSKASSKSVAGEVRQWKIMRQLGVASDEEIAKFADANHWLKHFPPLAEQDLSLLGAGIDWRRSFITTDANPYYDSFVRWQFEVLRQRRKVLFGKRFTVWSPHDNQACMDHERSSGEGVAPQEYVGIKIEVPRASQPPRLAAVVPAEERVFLVAATLRPETMIGQTNVWLRPDLDYVAWRAQKNEVFITTARAARNFSFQYVTGEFGKVDVLGTFRGEELLGMQVLAPLSAYAGGVYTLPMEAIDANKGTGVVTSVPAESPADYLALETLRGSAAAREKHCVREHMVLPFAPVPVIATPEYGSLSAKVVLEQLGLAGASAGGGKDTAALLADAHDRVYKSGFHKGTMLVGPHAGALVRDAKPVMREAMLAAGQAVTYAEPAERVVSRSGDECVVCLADQWYVDYGEAAWRGATLKALERVEMYSEEARNQMVASLNWLTQWACSRTYGLGTRLPWDPTYLIESLSDSTIYPAYYAVAHLLQGDVYGSRPGELGISAEQMTAAVWDIVLLGAPYDASCGIPEEKIVRMRREFTYWLPCNLRVSGKDLIPNHLSFYLYTHTAVFPEDKWPLGVRANGHLMLNGRPMSKSKGNFLTLHDACKTYSADAVRLALADAGDGLDDANFAESLANTAVIRLAGQIEWTRSMLAALPAMRTAADRLEGDVGAVASFADATFDAEMDRAVTETRAACEATQFKAALRHGFFDLQAARDRYVNTCGTLAIALRRELVSRFMEVQALLLSVFCPHTAEQMWGDLGHTTSILRARYPTVKSAVDEVTLAQSDYVQQLLHNARERLAKFTAGGAAAASASKKPEVAVICVATKQPPWQRKVIEIMHQEYRAAGGRFANDSLGAYFKDHADLQPHMKDLMAFALELREDARRRGEEAFLLAGASFAEDDLIRRLAEYIRRVLQVREVRVLQHGEAAKTHDADAANPRRVPRPGKPSITFAL